MTSVIVTGASGFVGANLLPRLRRDNHVVIAVARGATPVVGASETITSPRFEATPQLTAALVGASAVIHLAARVHVMRDAAQDPLTEYRQANVAGTLSLARAAAASGVRRFVFLSTIKVNGESTPLGQPFHETDQPAPVDPYAISKLEAELELRALAAATGMELVIIRLPLVYGPGVRANFQSLIRIVRRGWPLPLGAVHNLRSLIGVRNLADVIVRCLDHPKAAGETFLVSDGEDLSSPELVRRLARAMNRRSRVVPVPVSLLHAGASLLNKRDLLQRLADSLQVDSSKVRAVLDWAPPHTVDQELQFATATP